MKINLRNLMVASLCAMSAVAVWADSLVLLHTNDTHSMIFPDKDGLGGVQRRKVLIDSVRNAEKNVVLIDAGDAVQGTLFFKFFGGEVENPLMDMMGYDIRVVGNHEFDNGIEQLRPHLEKSKSVLLSSNYDVASSGLKGLFKPYHIKKIGRHKVGFIGLNIDPKSLITEQNVEGIVWHDVVATANDLAAMLKREKKCDLVVAVTHIGYEKSNAKTSDVELAQASCDIDIIIGGHSHTMLDPTQADSFPHLIKNADGKEVLVAQCGKWGKKLGYIKVNLDNPDKTPTYRLLSVDSRLDGKVDAEMARFLAPYAEVVDSVNNVAIARAVTDMTNEERCGALPNWTADYAMHFAHRMLDTLSSGKAPKADLAIMNVGGIRQPIYKGGVSEGQILSIYPFSNRMVMVKIKGADLWSIFEEMARKGGESVSDEVRIVVDKDRRLLNVLIDGEQLQKDRDYHVCTIDYLAWGNDDLVSFKKGEIVWSDTVDMSVRVLAYVRWLTEMGMPIVSDDNSRFISIE